MKVHRSWLALVAALSMALGSGCDDGGGGDTASKKKPPPAKGAASGAPSSTGVAVGSTGHAEPVLAPPQQVDLSRIHHHFASCDFRDSSLDAFEQAVNQDPALFVSESAPLEGGEGAVKPVSTDGAGVGSKPTGESAQVIVEETHVQRERIHVEHAEDGSIVGWVDRDGDRAFDSQYSLREASALDADAAEDSEEVVFRVHYDVEDRQIIYSDREHRHYRGRVEELQNVEVDITSEMATRQHKYYNGYWHAPASWVYIHRSHETYEVGGQSHREGSTNRRRPGEAGGPGHGK